MLIIKKTNKGDLGSVKIQSLPNLVVCVRMSLQYILTGEYHLKLILTISNFLYRKYRGI